MSADRETTIRGRWPSQPTYRETWAHTRTSILVVAQDMERFLTTRPVRALSGTVTVAYSIGQWLKRGSKRKVEYGYVVNRGLKLQTQSYAGAPQATTPPNCTESLPPQRAAPRALTSSTPHAPESVGTINQHKEAA